MDGLPGCFGIDVPGIVLGLNAQLGNLTSPGIYTYQAGFPIFLEIRRVAEPSTAILLLAGIAAYLFPAVRRR